MFTEYNLVVNLLFQKNKKNKSLVFEELYLPVHILSGMGSPVRGLNKMLPYPLQKKKEELISSL